MGKDRGEKAYISPLLITYISFFWVWIDYCFWVALKLFVKLCHGEIGYFFWTPQNGHRLLMIVSKAQKRLNKNGHFGDFCTVNGQISQKIVLTVLPSSANNSSRTVTILKTPRIGLAICSASRVSCFIYRIPTTHIWAVCAKFHWF